MVLTVKEINELEEQLDRAVALAERATADAVQAVGLLRSLHLVMLDGEWVDDRCDADPPCRFHPEDRNNTHGGAMHVHVCAQHDPARQGPPA